ncbi:DUF6344 domain-containing protein [Streptomyces sp. NPDC020681]|uniref:DUF6344 domain-containing protein n=1 Tax=Streptomyces sp. NPDC020681 TaxID=3365083 RepID=UPI00379E320D
MAAVKVRNLWTAFTAFIAALFALLVPAGLTATATTATAQPAKQPAARTPQRPALPRQARKEAVPPTVPAQGTRWSPGARDRSLPPTIKQRIRAEAHGSSPATRHVPAIDADDESGTGSGAAGSVPEQAFTSA